MNSLDRAEVYLTIPPQYGSELGGLRWSSNQDAIDHIGNRTTLAVVDEIRLVLEGVLAKPPVPPFAFVLNLLLLMKFGSEVAAPLRAAYESTRGTAGERNRRRSRKWSAVNPSTRSPTTSQTNPGTSDSNSEIIRNHANRVDDMVPVFTLFRSGTLPKVN